MTQLAGNMIKIYSKGGCPYCEYAKALLTQHGFVFEEIRVDLDDDARNFLFESGHRTVPQLYVNKTLLVEGGYVGLKVMTSKQIQERIDKINED